MPFTALSLDRLYLLRWASAPQTKADYDAVLAETGQICRTAGPVIAVGVIPVDMPSPAGDVRKDMNQKMTALLANCEAIHYVIEGSGFRASTLRSVATSLLLLTGRRGKIFVHKTFEEAIEAITPRLQQMNLLPSRVHMAARSKGLLLSARAAEGRPSLGG